MAAQTLVLSGSHSSGASPSHSHVDAVGDRLDVLRVDAPADSAQVVRNQPSRHWAVCSLPHPAVNQNLSTSDLGAGIASAVQPSGPQPAIVGAVDVPLDALFFVEVNRVLGELRVTVPSPPGVVALAPASGEGGAVASVE